MVPLWPSLVLFSAVAEPKQVSYSIEREILHDTSCFSEGFFIRDGALFESCGLNGKSKLVKYGWPPNPGGNLVQQRALPSYGTSSKFVDEDDTFDQRLDECLAKTQTALVDFNIHMRTLNSKYLSLRCADMQQFAAKGLQPVSGALKFDRRLCR